MIDYAEALATRPPDSTADVQADGGGFKVILRPQGCARWLVVGFLLLWLSFWLVGESFALGALLANSGVDLLAHLPFGIDSASGSAGGAKIPVIAFLLVWLTFWTLAGVAALATALRRGWGREEFTFFPGGWMYQHGIGSWGRPHRLLPGELKAIRFVPVRGLIAETTGKKLRLASLGTPEDQRWLRKLILDAAELPVSEEAPISNWPSRPKSEAPPGEPPRGWVATRLPDFVLSLQQTGLTRLKLAGGLALFAAFWNGIVSVFVVAKLHGKFPGSWFMWLFLTPFIGVGAMLIFGVFWYLLVREEWRAGRNWLEVRRRFLSWEGRRSFTNAGLRIAAPDRSTGTQTYTLSVIEGETTKTLQTGRGPLLAALGELLAAETGWELQYDANP